MAKRKRKIVDDDGIEIVAGMRINFSYGIPPVGVHAEVIERAGKLIALTPGHHPAEAPLAEIIPFFNVYVYKTHKEAAMPRDERLQRMARRIRQAIVREQERFAPGEDDLYCDAIALAFAAFHDDHWSRINASRRAYLDEARREQEQATERKEEAEGDGRNPKVRTERATDP